MEPLDGRERKEKKNALVAQQIARRRSVDVAQRQWQGLS